MVRRGGDVRVTGALPNSLDVSFDIREDLIFWECVVGPRTVEWRV